MTEQLFTRDGVARKPNGQTEKGLPIFRSKRSCSRCGGAGGSDKWIHTGWTCFQCNGGGFFGENHERLYTAEKNAVLDAAQAKRDAKKLAENLRKQAEEEARRLREHDEIQATYADLIARIRKVAGEKANDGFFHSIIEQVTVKSRRLSDAQIEAVERSLDKMEAEQARVMKAEWLGAIGDRLEFTLTLEKIITWGEAWEGYTYLLIFKTEGGSKVLYKGKSPHSFNLKRGWDEYSKTSFYELGQKVVVTATVKDHTQSKYNGEPETVITRPKVK